jgi:hypothetical protein
MEAVELSVLPGDKKVTDALNSISDHGGSGVVATGQDAVHVIDVDELLQALRTQGDVELTDVKHVLVDRPSPNGPPPVSVASVFKDEPLQSAKTAVVGNLTPKTANLLRTSVTLCRCTLDPTHVWLPDELSQAGRCNLDGAPVDCR